MQSLPAELLGLPALSMLNVSRNLIGPLLLLDPTVHCPTLRQLNLSFNQITIFPYQIGQAMNKLEELSLEGYVCLKVVLKNFFGMFEMKMQLKC